MKLFAHPSWLSALIGPQRSNDAFTDIETRKCKCSPCMCVKAEAESVSVNAPTATEIWAHFELVYKHKYV